MSRTHKCPVHGENGFDQEKAGTHIPEPITDCTCDVGATGPAAEGKGNTPVGPGLESLGNTPVGPGLGGGNTPAGPGK